MIPPTMNMMPLTIAADVPIWLGDIGDVDV
jgi:hypothetical protein